MGLSFPDVRNFFSAILHHQKFRANQKSLQCRSTKAARRV